MEFYELNRLYDETLKFTKPSDRVDSFLYFLMPTVISFGCVISLISIYSLSSLGSGDRPSSQAEPVHLTSKSYLYAQSVANFVFQLVTSVIFITNFYEKKLIDTYFQNKKDTYFSLKCFLNVTYNVLLYSVTWLLLVGAFDFCVVAIKKLNLHVSNSKLYQHSFERLIKSHQLQNMRAPNQTLVKNRSTGVLRQSTRNAEVGVILTFYFSVNHFKYSSFLLVS